MDSNLDFDFDWTAEDEGSRCDFGWSLEGLGDFPSACIGDIGASCNNLCVSERTDSRKRAGDESVMVPKSKAQREKMRRERLNDRFVELCSVLESGRLQKSDKAMILRDATSKLLELRSEAQQLKEANEKLQETIKELKAEKVALREEKNKLKVDKEGLEQQLKAIEMPPLACMPHLTPWTAPSPASFTSHGLDTAPKTAIFLGYPGAAMWHWAPPADVDTSQDHKLQSPAA